METANECRDGAASGAKIRWRSLVERTPQRLRVLLDGEVADFPASERARVLDWQQRRTHHALSWMFGMLLGFAAVKVAMVLAGAWPTQAHPALLGVLLVVLAGTQRGHARARSIPMEVAMAGTFVLALLLILVDPITNWPDRPAKSMGILLLLPLIGIPLLVSLRSALLFAGLCLLLAVAYFILVPTDAGTRNAVLLNLGIAVTASLRLRVARSDMSAGFVRSMQNAMLHATTDELTGLLNRHGWSHAAPAALESALSTRATVTLMFLDMDHFKRLNDTHGHAAGDQALKRMGRTLQSRLQSGSIAARIGGEEFVCILPGHEPEQVHRLAERLRRDLASANVPMTFSGGIARWNGREPLSQLMARADAAMYRAKSSGRDRVINSDDAQPTLEEAPAA